MNCIIVSPTIVKAVRKYRLNAGGGLFGIYLAMTDFKQLGFLIVCKSSHEYGSIPHHAC